MKERLRQEKFLPKHFSTRLSGSFSVTLFKTEYLNPRDLHKVTYKATDAYLEIPNPPRTVLFRHCEIVQ